MSNLCVFPLQEDEKNVEIKEEEKHLWNEAEKVMADNQDNISNSFEKQTPTRNDQTQSNQENSLWQLVEGKLELEECFQWLRYHVANQFIVEVFQLLHDKQVHTRAFLSSPRLEGAMVDLLS